MFVQACGSSSTPCEVAGGTDPGHLVAAISAPATADPVRLGAATCLVEHHPHRAEPLIEAWMGQATDRELALMVLHRLDALPSEVAVTAARSGLRGPHADVVRPAVDRARSPAVRAVLGVFGDD